MPRGQSETHILAYKFVSHFLREPFDYRKHGLILKEAQRLINPKAKEEVPPLDPAKVWGCLLAMEQGMFGFDGKLQSMWPINFMCDEGGTYYDRYCEWVKTPPPWYLQSEVKLWEMCTNSIAYPESSDIIDYRHELPYPIAD